MAAPLSDDQRLEIARRYIQKYIDAYRDLEPVSSLAHQNEISLEALAREYRRDKGVIARAIQAVRKSRRLDIRLVERPFEVINDESLAHKLKVKYDLPLALVAREVDRAADESPAGDDRSHRLVGYLMADCVVERALIQWKFKCGIGSGRAIAHMAAALRDHEACDYDGVTLTSLSGTYATEELRSIIVDADSNVLAMASYYPAPKIHLVANPIMSKFPVEEVRAATWLSPENWAQAGVKLAIVGVGLLSGLGDPRFPDAIHRGWGNPAVWDAIKAIRNVKGATNCVADIANYFFIVEGATGSLADTERSILEANVAVLNENFLTVSLDQLAEVELRLVCAGGAGAKHAAVRQILTGSLGSDRRRLKVISLCTDVATAEKLLA